MDRKPFGRYQLIALLAQGGMGEVWRAHDTDTDRIVAIKLLPAHLSKDEDFQRRFRREAHAAAQLNNPHVIPIHHYGEIDGHLYVDMRLIEGRDLQSVLTAGPLDPARAVRIVEQVAKALHAAHHVSLLHRDIKPSNILLDNDDFAYLIDFGIAHSMDETRMTKSGNTIGTFQYIAPERLDPGKEEDARTDIYSLACVLYEALTGKPPFAGSSAAHLVAAHLNTPPPRPSTTRPDLPTQVDEVIATGMAKDPNRRYATTIELANAAREAITVPSDITVPATEQDRPPQESAANDAQLSSQWPTQYAPTQQAPAPSVMSNQDAPRPQERRPFHDTTWAVVAAAFLLTVPMVALIVAVAHNSPGGGKTSQTSTPRSPLVASESPQLSTTTIPSADYQGFVTAVRNDGITGTDDVLDKNGDSVCQLLAAGQSKDAVTRGLIGPNDFTMIAAQMFVADSVTYLCPKYNS